MKIAFIQNHKRNNRGFTLIEFLVYLALAGALAAIIALRVGTADDTSRAQIIQDDINQIMGAAKNWKGVRVNYTGITFAQLTGQTFLRADWAAGIGVNPEGGNYTVAAAGQNLVITATGLPAQACQAVQSKMTGSVDAVVCAGTTITVTNR